MAERSLQISSLPLVDQIWCLCIENLHVHLKVILIQPTQRPKEQSTLKTCADFLKLNNSLGQVVIQSKKVRTSPTHLGVRAFQSCQGVWHYFWVFWIFVKYFQFSFKAHSVLFDKPGVAGAVLKHLRRLFLVLKGFFPGIFCFDGYSLDPVYFWFFPAPFNVLFLYFQ